MNLKIFEAMQAPELRTYLEFLLRHYRVMDSFWYLYIAEEFGEAAADRLNEKVWGRIAGMAARDLVKRLDIKERGLKGFVQALRYWPWCILVDYQIAESAGRGDHFGSILPDPGSPDPARTQRIQLPGDAPAGVQQLCPGDRPVHRDALPVRSAGPPAGRVNVSVEV